MADVVKNAPWAWMKLNGLPDSIPDDAELHVDEEAGTITVEVFATDADGNTMTHAGRVMVVMKKFPLKYAPTPELLAAYRHTVGKLRRERHANEYIRVETVRCLVEALGLDPVRAFRAIGYDQPPSIRRG